MEEACVCFHLEQIVLALPDERDALELAESVPLLNLLVDPREAHVCLSEHEVEDELLSPANDALDYIETEHTQTVQDVDALFEKRHVGLIAIYTAALDVLLHDRAQLYDLGEAGFAGYYSSNGRLNW